jgi:hypothetical protein
MICGDNPMPLIRSKIVPDTVDREDELVQELSRELMSEESTDQPITQPFIIEHKMPPTQYLHVSVVWEKWRLIPAGRRGGIIMKAYEKTASDRVNDITIAMGITTEEAVDLGLLPFAVVPTIRKNDQISEEQVVQWMKEEGAILTSSGLILRFPNKDLAEAAWERLIQKPKSSRKYWAVVTTTPSQG